MILCTQTILCLCLLVYSCFDDSCIHSFTHSCIYSIDLCIRLSMHAFICVSICLCIHSSAWLCVVDFSCHTCPVDVLTECFSVCRRTCGHGAPSIIKSKQRLVSINSVMLETKNLCTAGLVTSHAKANTQGPSPSSSHVSAQSRMQSAPREGSLPS